MAVVDPLTDAAQLGGEGRVAVAAQARALRYAVLVVDDASGGGVDAGERLAHAARVMRMPGSPPMALLLDGPTGWDAGGAASAARAALEAEPVAVVSVGGCVVVLVAPGEVVSEGGAS